MEKIPFNEREFRNGAVAINSLGCEITFQREVDGTFYYSGNTSLTNCSVVFAHENWSMKPTPLDDWIYLVDSVNPFDVLAGQIELLFACGDIRKNAISRKKGQKWGTKIKAIRWLTNKKEITPEIERKGIQTITEKEVKELQEIFLPKRKPSPPPITEIGPNETSRIAGEAILGFKKGNIVKCDIIGRLMK